MSSSTSPLGRPTAFAPLFAPGDSPQTPPPAPVLRTDELAGLAVLSTPDLRAGGWTRFGEDSVRGDAVTEGTLAGLVETARTAARSQGYGVGWAEGRRAAAVEALAETQVRELEWSAREARRHDEHREALQALTRAAQELAGSVSRIEREVSGHALELARELTEALVGHALSTSPDPVGDLVRRVLDEQPPGTPCTLRLHPGLVDDTALLDLVESGVVVVADPSLGPHDAVVEHDESILDLRVSAALERVREVLR